ncbi:14813_t:CDS:2, partial [Dentiscutata erythropus]
YARTEEKRSNTEVLYIAIHNINSKDMRTYNAPKTDEVAIIYGYKSDEEKPNKRDIIIKRNNNILIRISEFHDAYDSLQYPILFPFGEYIATNIIKDFNSNLTAGITKDQLSKFWQQRINNYIQEAKEDIQQENSQQKEIQQKEIIEVDDFSKTMSIEFDNLLQRSSGLSGVFDNIAFKSSTSMSISELSEEKIIEEEIKSQTELEKDNIESQTESEKDDNNS